MKRIITLHIEQKSNHWALTSKDDRPLSAFELAQCIAFHDFPSSLGLQLNMSGDTLLLTTEQLLRLLDESRLHFIAFQGDDAASEAYLTAIRHAITWLQQKDWQALSLDEQERFTFEHEDPLVAKLLTTYINERFRAVPTEQLSRVMQFMNEHAVLEQANTLPIRLALRLTEPEEEQTDWLAEVIIITEKNAHWTPARSKVNAPIEQALLKKWKPYAEELANLQSQLLSLCPTFSVDEAEHFFYASLNERQVQQLLKEDLTLLRAFHFEVILPSWLKQLTETKITARAEAMTSYKKTASFDDIVEFDWQFAIGDQQIDRATFEQLLEEQRQFIRIADEWFHIDDVALQKLKALIEEAEAKEWTVRELLLERQADDEDNSKALFQDDGDSPVLAFTLNKQLRQFAKTFREKKEIPVVALPNTLQATLRPYQREGFDWLVFMRQYEFGACLADDMGLGKTIQLITYLLHVKEQNPAQPPALIICPTSVLGNWQKELERFAPSLKIHVHYGQSRVGEHFGEWMNDTDADVILTTYGTATQDSEALQHVVFSTIALDEAQNIKNMQTKQSRAIRSLQGHHYIALTGTPIENRLSELWAIFDFMFQGYFGSFTTFTKEYIIPIERDDDEATKRELKLKIEPFLLRRTKNDPHLKLDLPEKVEQNEYVPLTEEQAALYEGYIQSAREKMHDASPFERKGIVLAMLNRLKQLCNHPALYLKEPIVDAPRLMERSYKLDEIVKRSAQIASDGEQCLIFTQYLGMGELIQYCLAEQYGLDVPFLTGSMRKDERDRLVEAFQNREFPIFILSLRAGGTGLNLTAANYVLHADRWWNPAVENQATDRAYRIGQTKFVHVSKFVTLGTIEEKIDKMLAEKMALSDELVQSSRWITELSDDELDQLFSL